MTPRRVCSATATDRSDDPHGTFTKDLPYFPGWMDMFVVPQDSVSVERAIDDVTMAMRRDAGAPARPAEQL